MEINHYGDTILGVVATEDIVEGRMILLTSHSFSYDFGSLEDVPGAKLPDNATEAVRARYCITFAQDNRDTPIYEPNPHFDWALRYGFDQAANAPFSPTYVYLTHPGQQEGLTIYSGNACIAFGEGIYTVPSGAYVYSAELEIPGMPLVVCNANDDGAAHAGKLKYGASNTVAEVYRFDSSTNRLTFKILH
jgi:hypothetical protein